MDSAVANALRAIAAQGRSRMHILSDANSVFISEILAENGLSGVFQEVHTNPAGFDDSGALRVKPYHSEAAPHTCSYCPENLCKGLVLEKLLMLGLYRRLVYVGDGGNDFCPSCRTGPWDFVLARKSYPDGRPGRLLAQLAAAGAAVDEEGGACQAPGSTSEARGAFTGTSSAATVIPWATAGSLASLMRQLLVDRRRQSAG